jgi:hypothetical protein
MKIGTAKTVITYGKTGTRRPGTKIDRPPAIIIRPPKDTPGIVNGRLAGSMLEWNVARALWILQWDFYYQLDVLGGHSVRGGFTVDFLVSTVPARTPLMCNGRYFHTEQVSEYQATQITRALRAEGYHIRDTLVLWEEHGLTVQDAVTWLSEQIGKG